MQSTKLVKLHSILFGLIFYTSTLGFVGCSKVMYTNIEATPVVNPSHNFAWLSISEGVPEGCRKVADFEYRESWSADYSYLLKKFEKIASDKNADIFKIKELYTGNMKTKGAAMRFIGSIYTSGKPDVVEYLDSLNKTGLTGSNDKVLLYIYRTDWGGPSLFDVDLYINSEHQGKLDKKDIKIIELDKDGDITISSSPRANTGLKIKVEYGKKYYIQATQVVNSAASPNSIQVGVGGQEFRLKEGKQGLLEYDALKFRFECGYK